MNGNLAEILGLLCAEGNYREFYANYKEFDKRRNKSYLRKNKRERILEFSNKNKKLINRFLDLLKIEFSYSPKIYKAKKEVLRICITKWDIIDCILNFTSIGCDKWFVPKNILNGDAEIKKCFIRGYFMGDGSIGKIGKNRLRLRLTSINYQGISNISKMLISIGIRNNLNGPYFRKNQRAYYEILIRSVSNQRFINEILRLDNAGVWL